MSPNATGSEGRRALADRLHSAAIHLLRRVRVRDPQTGASAARLSALSVLVYSDALTMGELAAAEQVKRPTISRLVSGLEADGLVARAPDSTDKRVIRVSATPAGRALLERGRRMRLDVLEHDLGQCSPDDLSTLQAAVAIMERLFGHH